MPELRDYHCLKDGFNRTSRDHLLGYEGVLTEILLDYIGIVEIDHAGGQLMERRTRRWDWNNDAPQKRTLHKHIYT